MAPPARTPWSDRLGEAALYLTCITAFSAPAGAEGATILLALAFLLALPRWRRLAGEPVALIALVAAGYGVAQTLVLTLIRPDHAGLYLEGLTDWARLLMFIPFAFFSRGDERRLDFLMLLALAGLLGGMLYRLDWPTLFQDLDAFLHRRAGYGSPALVFALHSGAGLIGLITVGRVLLRRGADGTRLLAAGGWILAFALLLTGLSLTSARSGWLALLAAAPVALWVTRRGDPGSGISPRKRRWLRVSAGLLAGLLVLVAAQRTIDRVAEEKGTLSAILAGEEPAMHTSDAIRWNALRFGIETWLERPLFGWGAGSSDELITGSGRVELGYGGDQWLEHLHNAYLEILVQFGLAGLTLAAAFLLVLGLRLRRLCRGGRISARYCGFFAGVLVLVLVWSLFDYRVPHGDWRVFWMILAGSAYGFLLRARPAPAVADD
jgi:O-antigen ligase